MDISSDRMNHILAVANKMREIAKNQPDFAGLEEEMFILGFLHDVGYAFAEVQKEHAHLGGEKLKLQGYKYWQEVFHHGSPQNEYNSQELMLLNYVDMTTSPNGKSITIKERIEDIEKRYGSDSIQAKEAIIVAEKLKNIFDAL